jgi:hypothetical protein
MLVGRSDHDRPEPVRRADLYRRNLHADRAADVGMDHARKCPELFRVRH